MAASSSSFPPSSPLLRPSNPKSMWESDELGIWSFYLSVYPRALALKRRDNHHSLPHLEQSVWKDLPNKIRNRDPMLMTVEEYRHLVEWKLQRGKFRPSLKGYANRVDPDHVERATAAALLYLKQHQNKNFNVLTAMEPLLQLYGCGPATASAALAIMDNGIPFMSDELLGMTVGPTYTKDSYYNMFTMVIEKADKLTALGHRVWSARDVERAAFSYTVSGMSPPANFEIKDTDDDVIMDEEFIASVNANNSKNQQGSNDDEIEAIQQNMAATAVSPSPASAKRGRGRPRKTPLNTTENAEDKTLVVKKKRGRKPKVRKANDETQQPNGETNNNQGVIVTKGRKRGRKPKKLLGDQPGNDANGTTNNFVATQDDDEVGHNDTIVQAAVAALAAAAAASSSSNTKGRGKGKRGRPRKIPVQQPQANGNDNVETNRTSMEVNGGPSSSGAGGGRGNRRRRGRKPKKQTQAQGQVESVAEQDGNHEMMTDNDGIDRVNDNGTMTATSNQLSVGGSGKSKRGRKPKSAKRDVAADEQGDDTVVDDGEEDTHGVNGNLSGSERRRSKRRKGEEIAV